MVQMSSCETDSSTRPLKAHQQATCGESLSGETRTAAQASPTVFSYLKILIFGLYNQNKCAKVSGAGGVDSIYIRLSQGPKAW